MRLTFATAVLALLGSATLSVAADDTLGLRPTIGVTNPTINLEPAPAVNVPQKAAATDEDPYAALGIRAGGFILYPSLTLTGGYTTNANGVAGGPGSGFGILTPELLIQSDWDRHEATLTLRGSYEKFTDPTVADAPTGSADATARIDMADGWSTDLAAGYLYNRQSISDPNFPLGADSPPGVHEFTGSEALNGEFGRGSFTLEGSADRTAYDNATSGGLPVDQGDRTNTLFAGRLRVGFEATPTLTPFVEGEVSRRLYDRKLDNSGLDRAAVGTALRAGVAFDTGPLLKGDVSVGLARADFDDPALATIQAVTFAGSLTWAPTELTTATFDASTALNPSADPTSSGSVQYDGSVDVAYAWRRNVTIDWTADLSHQTFQGTNEIDTTYHAGVAATWKLNRTAWLTGGYVHEWLVSNVTGSNYQSDAIRLELRLQH
jgi:hypothetical protein